MKLAARVLGASPKRIEVHRPLLELGLDSLMGVELAMLIEHDFSLALPVQALQRDMTLSKLATILLEHLFSSDFQKPIRESFGQAEKPVDSFSNPYLVSMKSGASRPPLLLVHAVGGDLSIYRHLVNTLSRSRPVFGVQSRLMTGSQKEHSTLAKMASEYVGAVRERWSEGPYYLCGFSLGGYLSLRMAKILEDLNQQVAFVGVIEWSLYPADNRKPKRDRLSDLIVSTFGWLEQELGIVVPVSTRTLSNRAAELASELLSEAPGQRSRFILEWLTAEGYLTEVPSRTAQDYLSRLETHLSMLSDELPLEPIQAPLCLWRARRGFTNGSPLWCQVSNRILHEEVLDGDHFSLMQPPQVEILASQMEKSMARLDLIGTGAR